MKRTPVQINMLMEAYYLVDGCIDSALGSPAQRCAYTALLHEELITNAGVVTDKGIRLVQYILDAPTPENRWVMPHELDN